MISAKELISKIPESDIKDLEFIAKKIQEEKQESYLIGGSVRDLILQKIPHEYDITTSMLPEEVKKKFKRVIETGIQHGTVTVMLGDNAYEITTFRKDIEYTDGRRPDKIEFGATLSEDLKRRDFTMNAIALDILSQKVVDEHDGILDIRKKTIRTIGNPLERFGEDGLRPIRAIRFMSSLGFEIEPETYKAIYSTRSITGKISKERFHDELNKILLTKNSSIGLIELSKNQIFELFTDVKLSKVRSSRISEIDKLINKPLGLKLAFLLDWILEDNNKQILAEQILKDFRYSKHNTKDSLFYLDLFQKNFQIEKMNLTETRKLLSLVVSFTSKREIESIIEGLLSYLQIVSTSESVRKFKEIIIEIFNSTDALTLKELKINGNKIIEKFPELDKRKLGSILQDILEKVLIDPKVNSEESSFQFIRERK